MRLALCFFLLIATIAPAQVRMPSDVTVPVGRLASVKIDADADQIDYVIVGQDVDAFREYDPNPTIIRLRVIGYKPGTATVVVAAQKAGKLLPIGQTKIIIGDGPAPGPNPGPGPTPVPPAPDIDPDVDAVLFGQLKAAKGTWNGMVDLATIFLYHSQKVADSSVNKASQLRDLIANGIASAFPRKDVPPGVQTAIAKYLTDNLPREPDAVLDRAAHATVLYRLGKTLEAAK